MKRVSVVIVAYQDEPWLEQCVHAALNSIGVEVEVLVVDNGSPSVVDLNPDGRLQILQAGSNIGFAGGCNFAVSLASFETLVFVNSDLVVDSNALRLLTSRLDDETIGLATGAVLLPGAPRIVNAVGNPIHFLMFSWAGGYGEPFVERDMKEYVAGVSGAFFACTREHWVLIDGFDERYFAYAEDVDISIRTWQFGRTVVLEPRAIGIHHYEFSRNHRKWFYLERNRLINFFTLYDLKSIALLLPIFLSVEIGVLLASVRGGWSADKVAAWRWLLRHRAYLGERRSLVKSAKQTRSDNWISVLSAEMVIPDEFGLRVPTPINRVMKLYWNCVKKWIG
jgi:GT2 family glycosyltransferase